MSIYAKELAVAKEIAREAGAIMLQYFEADQKVEIKEDNSQVTIADKLINSLVIRKLSISFPDDGVIGEEESNTEYGMGRKWFCDPIDGTAGYICGIPTAMFSLALVIDGRPVLGVAYDPFLDKLYSGQTGAKSLCNGTAISVSSLDLKSGVFAVSSSTRSLPKTKYFQRMIDDKVRFISLNGAVYKACLVAKGKVVGYVENGISAHDVAAVQVILEGAGGKITSVEGETLDYSQPFRGVIISNKITHAEIIRYCA